MCFGGLVADGVAAEGAAAAGVAGFADPDGVEMGDGGFDEVGIVAPNAGFKIAFAVAFHADAGAGEVGGADIDLVEVKHDELEVDARAEHAFEAVEEGGVAVEVLAESGAGFFGVDEADMDAALDQIGEFAQKRPGGFAAHDEEVFEVGGANPQAVLHGACAQQHIVVVRLVGDIAVEEGGGHGWQCRSHGLRALADLIDSSAVLRATQLRMPMSCQRKTADQHELCVMLGQCE